MTCSDPFLQFDSENFALALQLDEITTQRESQTGKWNENKPPDYISAFDNFEDELKHALLLAEDEKLAHSIAKAVYVDALAIEEACVEETQSQQDRALAMSLAEERIPQARTASGPSEISCCTTSECNWDHVLRATESSTLSEISQSTMAGRVTDYTLRQNAVLEHLPRLKVECSVCGVLTHPHLTVKLHCDDIYCKSCLKSFFLRVAKDETLFPPRCHSQRIEFSLIEQEMSVEELSNYREAEEEFSCDQRVYCANVDCGRFVPLSQRSSDRASCKRCGTGTCTSCKAPAHDGVCPVDEAKQNLLQFADEQGWRICFGCGEMVYRYEGCDHMTCRCRTEFCYRCGMKWKTCVCDDWEPGLLNQRAQLVVDREARDVLPAAVRDRRVRAMERELQAGHECNHPGKFERRMQPSRGAICEMCGTKHWKYILACRQCHLIVCEDCRRYRV